MGLHLAGGTLGQAKRWVPPSPISQGPQHSTWQLVLSLNR